MVSRLSRRQMAGLLGVAGVALAAALFLWAPGTEPAAAPSARPTAAAAQGGPPEIALSRLDAPNAPAPIGRRDVFDFAKPPAPPAPPPTAPPAPVAVLPPPDADGLAMAPPPPPSLNVKFVGSVQSKSGVNVAIFVTDSKEILTGAQGEIVGNRLRIIKIGLESVDVQDTAGGGVRRIPLRGN
jgi:type IV secretory pathway VirB10-like protein